MNHDPMDATKDSPFLVSAGVLEQLLNAHFGSASSFVLFTDLVRDSIPGHLIGAKVFLWSQAATRQVVKLGSLSALREECKHITKARNALAQIGSGEDAVVVRIPEPYRVVDLRERDLAALVLEFCGLHTLERYRISGSSQEMVKGLAIVLERLRNAGLVWPGAMPRNIAESVSLQGVSYLAALDWERPALEIPAASDDMEFYVRCIELREESAACLPNILPYWSRRWPPLQELSVAGAEVRCLVDLCRRPDPRFARLGECLGLGTIVDDAQYWRLIHVLSQACETMPTIHSVLYALDYLSEWLGVEWRVDCSLLLWFLGRSRPDQKRTLSKLLAVQAECLHRQWRTSDSTGFEHVILEAARRVETLVDDLVMAIVGRRDWRQLARQTAVQFIQDAAQDSKADCMVLCMLE